MIDAPTGVVSDAAVIPTIFPSHGATKTALRAAALSTASDSIDITDGADTAVDILTSKDH
jgi:hypothetical protein